MRKGNVRTARKKTVRSPQVKATPNPKPKPKPKPIARPKPSQKPKPQPRTKAIARPGPKRAQGQVQEKKLSPHKSKRELDLRRFEKLLLSERSRLLLERSRIEQRTARRDRMSAGDEHSHYDDHIADMATDAYEREKDLASEDNIASILENVNLALQKIRAKTYGLCDMCSKDIETPRLNALPSATLCLHCQTMLES